jgi:hypothetical protein
MTPLDLYEMLFKFSDKPQKEWPSLLAQLSAEERRAFFELSTKSTVPNCTGSLSRQLGVSVDKAQELLAEKDENLKYTALEMLEVDQLLRHGASKVPSTEMLSIVECHNRSRELVAEIFECWKAIHIILAFHEERIQKPWTKKSKAQRKELLLTVWPRMSPRHRPDMDDVLSYQSISDDTDTMVRSYEAAVWPYINLEDLLEPRASIIFSNSRGRNHPDVFAYSDLELAPTWKSKKEFLALRKDNCTMEFIGLKTVQTYGRLGKWNSFQDTVGSMKTRHTVHLDHGLQILTIQEGIWKFLSRCVGLILEDVLREHPAGDLALQVGPPLSMSIDQSVTSLNVIARELPYRLPSQLDLPRLQALANAQKSLAMDHAIAVREDPGYFVEVTERFRDHRPDLILNADGLEHPLAKDFPMYNKAQRQLAADAHCAVFVWHEIHERITKLRCLSSKFTQEICIEKDLPNEYLEALAKT